MWNRIRAIMGLYRHRAEVNPWSVWDLCNNHVRVYVVVFLLFMAVLKNNRKLEAKT
jgi:hypothetical protein